MTIAQNIFRFMTASDNETGAVVAMNARTEAGTDFAVTTPENFGSDKRTRLLIFATGICGSATNFDTSNDLIVKGGKRPNFAEAVFVEARKRTGPGLLFSLPVEFAGAQGTIPGLDQLNLVLPSGLAGAGTVELTFIVNGQRSNTATIVIR
jgi:uncharacterized protein (TIGR03437 family)